MNGPSGPGAGSRTPRTARLPAPARRAGDFPTALTTARTLDWEGHHRVEGDVWWPQGEMDRAAAAYEAARIEAEQHGIAGEHATSQAQRAFVLAFTDPDHAADELELAEQLLTGLTLRATTLTTHTAALIRIAGTPGSAVENRASVRRADIRTAGVTAVEVTLELGLCFHHAVRGDDAVQTAIARLHDLTQSGDYACYIDIAHFMADLPLPADRAQQTQWVEAMLSGISVIAAPLPGNREALGDDAQYAPRDDVDEWVAALCRLENRGVYAAAAARARAHTAGLDYAADLAKCKHMRPPDAAPALSPAVPARRPAAQAPVQGPPQAPRGWRGSTTGCPTGAPGPRRCSTR
ncbi:hypothetical protein AB0B92_29825 [Streptomyces hygroscopicus]|uniref:hypothetical protein n=1 Tax=Streptomyces hygroscopicus TaxID=1912 RepID=UPI0033E127CA